ncbi:MAG: nuclear transport factor 2 family protein [Myxococcales bacterium FL481]|nr:MAG: nuclear transport factor 2 family protein [Myxococcales bacterium FL481]
MKRVVPVFCALGPTLRPVLLSTAVATVAACRSSHNPRLERQRSEMRAVLEAQAAAWNRGDIDGYMQGYARRPDLLFASGGSITRGWQPARNGYVERYGPGRMGHLEFTFEEVTPLSTDAGIVVGRYHLRDSPRAGDGVFTLILRRDSSGWAITHDHTSATPDAPGSQAATAPTDKSGAGEL